MCKINRINGGYLKFLKSGETCRNYSKSSKSETVRKDESISNLNNDLNDLRKELYNDKPEWFIKLCEKQKNNIINESTVELFKDNGNNKIFENIVKSGNIQLFLTFLTYDKDIENVSNKFDINGIEINTINIENCFIIILYSILKWQTRQYSNKFKNEIFNEKIETILNEFNDKELEIYVCKEISENTVFKEKFEDLLNFKTFQKAVYLLKIRLVEIKKWNLNLECRDDNLIIWINSLFEPSNLNCMLQLTKTKYTPNIILYDLLLRKLKNELEYKFFFECYKNFSYNLNLYDQKKLYFLKKFDLKLDRNLIITPLFNNLFTYSIRSKIENLPKLIDLFLNDNNIYSEQLLEQISEMIWNLSFDHTGEFINKPSRYYNISQTKLIKTVNNMIKNNKSLEIDVTTMLGVSNLTFYKDFRKSFQMFKNAKKQFDHWQLIKFQPKNFKKIGMNNNNNNNNNYTMNEDILYNNKIDYNIKFLCNSILLLAINENNRETILKDLINIFNKVEPKILKKYPEIWDFVLVKLSYHNLINENILTNLFLEYMKVNKAFDIKNHFFIDFILNKTNKFRIVKSVIDNLLEVGKTEELDDNNKSHLISKLYKLAKNDLNNSEKCLKLARKIYKEIEFKSTRINSSHLLGESIFTPKETFERYTNMNENFKLTQISLSSLFISIYKLNEMGIYDFIKWENDEPLNFAIKEFNNNICKSYGDINEGKIYPNDNLLKIYIKDLSLFNKNEELIKLLELLVDLKYPINLKLFETYLESIRLNDKIELINCLNLYDNNFKTLRNCKTEYELNNVKKRLNPVVATGNFKEFVEDLDINWDLIQRWNWPGRNHD